jgi:hypothetical protein
MSKATILNIQPGKLKEKLTLLIVLGKYKNVTKSRNYKLQHSLHVLNLEQWRP